MEVMMEGSGVDGAREVLSGCDMDVRVGRRDGCVA